MMRRVFHLIVIFLISLCTANPALSESIIPVENASFESPIVDPNISSTLPDVDGWTEIDNDISGGTNTGVLANAVEDNWEYVNNADGNQLAFLGSEQGNTLEQDLAATYKTGCDYQLTVGLGVVLQEVFPTSTVELVLYYQDGNDLVDIVSQTVEPMDLFSTQLEDFSLYLPVVDSNDPWAGKNIGLAIRATGSPGGFWLLDNVRLIELPKIPVTVKNASFELPETDFVDVVVDSWQMPPVPLWYDESSGYLWIQLTGVFLNLDPSDPDYIDNCDGNQAVWLFAVPEVELFQDLADTYEIGRVYQLTVGIIGGGGNMKDDVPIEIRLYYRDDENNKVTVGATSYTYDLDIGRIKHFEDVRLDIPPVEDDDLWAGRNIGVQLISALTLADLDPDTGRAGGFWDLDNVRLTKSLPEVEENPVDDPNGSEVIVR
jgi:hypothetical protein